MDDLDRDVLRDRQVDEVCGDLGERGLCGGFERTRGVLEAGLVAHLDAAVRGQRDELGARGGGEEQKQRERERNT